MDQPSDWLRQREAERRAGKPFGVGPTVGLQVFKMQWLTCRRLKPSVASPNILRRSGFIQGFQIRFCNRRILSSTLFEPVPAIPPAECRLL
jgi:hypothetical protein